VFFFWVSPGRVRGWGSIFFNDFGFALVKFTNPFAGCDESTKKAEPSDSVMFFEK
jgi:hypothetical protein